jgi:hypothetical protein
VLRAALLLLRGAAVLAADAAVVAGEAGAAAEADLEQAVALLSPRKRQLRSI